MRDIATGGLFLAVVSTEAREERKDLPLVSVGIPAYNKPEGLRKTLEQITGQTYKNLEIIVSDDGSIGNENVRVVQEFQKIDARIRFFRHEINKGQVGNYNFVLEHATGDYFMLAADDDIFELFYIEECLDVMKQRADVVGVTMEVRYFSGNHYFDVFHESAPYHAMNMQNSEERVVCLLKNSTGGGNILYSLFRRNVLFRGEKTLLSVLTTRSLNEIPFLMLVIEQGNLIVLPKIGLNKQTNSSTYTQAKWEVCGGFLPVISISGYLNQVYANLKYHVDAYRGIIEAISFLQIKYPVKIFFIASWEMAKHFGFLTLRYKPKKRL
jgi:glycosyltransferase involved in cell wall biosynthesis